MNKTKQYIIIFLFAIIIFGVPITQCIIEITEGEVPHIVSLFTQPPLEENLRDFEDQLQQYSFAENSIRPVMLYLYYQLGDAGSKAAKGLSDWLFYMPSLDYVLGPDYDDPRIIKPVNSEPKEDWDVIETILDFRDQLAKKDIDLVLVPVPTKISVYPEKGVNKKFNNKGISRHTADLIKKLENHEIHIINLLPYFLDNKKNNNMLYLPHDTHWSGKGVTLAAKLIANHIKQYDWYNEATRTTKYVLEDTIISRYGDIAMMTGILHQDRVFSPDTVHCQQVLEKSNSELYRDSNDSPIMFLGDSFSRIYQKDQPKAAGIIAHLAYELQMPLTSIVNDGGASTLVREQLARKKELLNNKKVVVWEFAERDIRFGLKGWKKVNISD